MSFITMELKGLEAVKKLFDDLEEHLRGSELRKILEPAGKLVLDQAKAEVPYTGEIGEAFKKDLAVYRDRGTRNAEYILVGARFKPYTIHGRPQKVALIAQHMTQGFAQTDRLTKKGKVRGRVRNQLINPVLDALRQTKDQINNKINEGVVRQLQKVKSKYPQLVK